MRHLKRFRNWLGYAYHACWAFGQQFGAGASIADERAAEEEHPAAADAALVDSGPALAALPSSQQSEVVPSSTPSVPAQTEPAPVEKVVSVDHSVDHAPSTPHAKPVKETTVTDKKHVAPIATPKKVVTPAQKVKAVPQETVKTQPSAVTPPKTEHPQAASAKVKPQSTNGSATAPPSVGGKYDPGIINDQTAQRLARLLVSEIKLYYKSKTDGEGASEVKNIYDMLKDPIDKSRQHYKQRMGATAIKSMPDYFHGELVRSLCGGDPSRLGPNYQATSERP